MIGMVDDVERGRDNIIRMVNVKYYNGHNKTPQFTLRTVRKMVKLWNIDDMHLDEDLAELQRKFGPIDAVAAADQDEDLTDNQGGAHAEPNNESLVQVDDILVQLGLPGAGAAQLGEGVHQPQGDANLGGDQVQGGAAAGLLLGDLRVDPVSRADCKVCCCMPHHLLSFHYSGSKFLSLPSIREEADHSILAMELDKDNCSGDMEEVGGGLEQLIMSVNVNLS